MIFYIATPNQVYTAMIHVLSVSHGILHVISNKKEVQPA